MDFDLGRYEMVAFFIAAQCGFLLFVSSILAYHHYFTMWREEILSRRRKPMIGSVMRLCKRINTLRRNQAWYEYVLDL